MRPLIIALSILVIPLLLLSILTAGTASMKKEATHHLSSNKEKIKPGVLLSNNEDSLKADPISLKISVAINSRQEP